MISALFVLWGGYEALKQHNFEALIISGLAVSVCVAYAAWRVRRSDDEPPSGTIFVPLRVGRARTAELAVYGLIFVAGIVAMFLQEKWFSTRVPTQSAAGPGKPGGSVSTPDYVYEGFFQNGIAIWFRSQDFPGVAYISTLTGRWSRYPDDPDRAWQDRKYARERFGHRCNPTTGTPWGGVGKNIYNHFDLLKDIGCLQVVAGMAQDCAIEPNNENEVHVEKVGHGWVFRNVYAGVDSPARYDYTLQNDRDSDLRGTWTWKPTTGGSALCKTSSVQR